MLVVRPCKSDHPNAVVWDASYKSAAPLCRLFYDSMGWDAEYLFRIPCRTVTRAEKPGDDNTQAPSVVLFFDLDNYIGRALSRKEEIDIARRVADLSTEQSEDAKSYYYPPDAEEPEEIHDMEQRLEQIRETGKRILGTPFALHSSIVRTPDVGEEDGEWDMLAEAVPLDVSHTVDTRSVDDLLLEIMEDPPRLPVNRSVPGEAIEEVTE